ncbi:hypothetical protein [Streptomyces marincola]|uniref:hypothetical protein n=1 Tax=Streptomyces marincola TaxID=2878388 RepID=UPI001CF3554E|nr:hypothetical protein [Streptomyces marincola]UCM90780.1 hypothetical protein LC193_24130 [Streptomyces marincola]
MPTFEELAELSLETLDRAVEDWRQAKTDFDTMADEARTALRGKAESADWRGVNAGVTKRFITTVADRFGFAHEQAAGIHRVLEDLGNDLRAHRTRLLEVRQEAESQGLFVTRNGRVLVNGESPVGGTVEPLAQQELNETRAELQPFIDEYAARIERILAEAAETDALADRALRELAGAEDSAFRATDYDTQTIEEVQGRADAERVQELMAMEPAVLSDDELAELDRTLRDQAENEHFGVALATGLGPEGALRFWTGLTAHPYPPGDQERTDLLTSLGNGFGAALGTATRSDDPAMRAWEADMIALGPQRIDLGMSNGPLGFQVMSDLMAGGTYGEEFLTDYGGALISYERAMDAPGSAWNNSSINHLPPEVFARDPMIGYMDALSRTPAAATDVFLRRDTMEYLLDRPVDHLPVEAGDGGGYAFRLAIGDALFAATTGLEPGTAATSAPEHSRESRIVLNNAVNVLAAVGGDGFPVEYREPLAGILVNRGDLVIDSVAGLHSERPIDRNELFDVVTQISADPASYALLNEGMNFALVQELGSMPDNPDLPLLRAGETVGFLEGAYREALRAEAAGEIAGASSRVDWATYTLGTAADFVPFVGGAISGAVDMVAQSWLEGEAAAREDEQTRQKQDISDSRDRHLEALANHWITLNEDWAGQSDSHNSSAEVYAELRTAANLGLSTGEGDSNSG